MKTKTKTTIDSNVTSFISTFVGKLWNRIMGDNVTSGDPRNACLDGFEGFCVAFEMFFGREASGLELDIFVLEIYEREHLYFLERGKDTHGFMYSRERGHLVMQRAKVAKQAA